MNTMGAICPQGVTTSGSIEVNAPPDIIWSVITDINNYPKILSYVNSVVIVGSNQSKKGNKVYDVSDSSSTPKDDEEKTKIELYDGFAWHEIRSYNGRDIILKKTITSIGSEDRVVYNETTKGEEMWQQKYIRIHLSFLKTKEISNISHYVPNCSTLTIDSTVDLIQNENTVTGTLDENGTTCSTTKPCCCTLTGSMSFIPSSLLMQIALLLLGRGEADRARQMCLTELNDTKREAEQRYQQHQQIESLRES